MMTKKNKKYGYVTILKANKDNDNFKGEKRVYVYGNKGMCQAVKDETICEEDIKSFVRYFGYNRKCDVNRVMKWHKENIIEIYWDKEYQLVEVEF